LEWKTPPRSSDATEPYYFYIINVRQISANDRSGRKFAPLQVDLSLFDITQEVIGRLK